LRLFNDSTGAQVGGTLTGSLTAFQQFRYLDVFGINGVNAPAGDQANIRAEFTQTSGGSANLIGFCTVQDNTSFGGGLPDCEELRLAVEQLLRARRQCVRNDGVAGHADNQALTTYCQRPAGDAHRPATDEFGSPT
jgi:hypothetical protein